MWVNANLLPPAARNLITPTRLFENDETKARHMTADLAAGDKAPDFRLARDGGSTVSLADFKGKKLVLYFYPRPIRPDAP